MSAPKISRRRLLNTCCASGLLGGGAVALAADSPAADPFPTNAAEALRLLMEGNRRFVSGNRRHHHQGKDWRKSLTSSQKPFATILSCSDSRVPIELIFDQGFGDLFVIRVAGNVIATDVVGSIQYAVRHLKTSLLLVLGHQGCGAVTAALAAIDGQATEPHYIEALVESIEPGLKDLDPKLKGEQRLQAAVEANVRWSISQLLRLPEAKLADRNELLAIQGAVYELSTGEMRLVGLDK